MTEDELLRRLLALAGREGVLSAERLADMAAAFRERGDRIVADRVAQAEALVAWHVETIAGLEVEKTALAREIGWHRQTITGLEVEKTSLAQELGWKRDTIAGLEVERTSLTQELEWKRETIAGLEVEKATLAREQEWLRETKAGLERDVQALAREKQALAREKQDATEAHDRVAAHLRHVAGEVTRQIEAAAALPVWKLREVRARLRALVEILRREIG